MTTVSIRRSDGDSVTLDSSAVESLKAELRGPLLFPGDDGYDASRTVWNAMIDRRPALAVHCAGVNDIKRAVDFARAHGLLTSVKGGGHNIAGSAVCDGGFLIDLSGMRSVRVDPEARVAHVEPGATLGDFDSEAQAFGLATPLGINSTTGVAGLTLGGGFGWFSRKHGMTIDNLLAVDVITADGRFVRASGRENADLFWALRGGGGNFGIVTRFEFRLHPLGPGVLSGLVVYPLNEAASALKQYRQFAKEQSDETTVWTVLRKAPPLPFLPPEVHGTEIIAFALFHAGDPEAGRKAIEPVRHFGKALGEFIGVQPYRSWQQAFDPLLTPGARNYWKSHNFTDLSDGAIETVIKYVRQPPVAALRNLFRSDRRSYDAACRRLRGVPPSQHHVCVQRPRSLGYPGGRPERHGVGAGVLPRHGAARHGRGVRQFPYRRRVGPGQGGLWSELPEAGGDQEKIRPAESVPDQPEYPS